MTFDALIDNARILSQGAFSLTGESEDKQTPLENSVLELWANEALRDLSAVGCINETRSLGSTWLSTTDNVPYIALPTDTLQICNAYTKNGSSWNDLEPANNFRLPELMSQLSTNPKYYRVEHYNEAGVDKRIIAVYGVVTGYTLYVDITKIHPTMTYKGVSQELQIPEFIQPALTDYISFRVFSLAATSYKDPNMSAKMTQLGDRHFTLYNKAKKQAQIDVSYTGRTRFRMMRDSY